jgi:hypothetical protein
MATTFQQRSKALNLWSPDETERFKLSTVDYGFGREAVIDYKDGSGVVQFPGPLVYVHQGLRVTLGDTIAALSQADSTESARALAAEADIQAALTYESAARVANVVAINEKTAYLEDRANTSSQQHFDDDIRLTSEITRATGVEADLQSQISALLSNTDAVALNSLAEIVTDYRENGQGVASSLTAYQTSNDTALADALARINLLETFIYQLQDTTSGAGD